MRVQTANSSRACARLAPAMSPKLWSALNTVPLAARMTPRAVLRPTSCSASVSSRISGRLRALRLSGRFRVDRGDTTLRAKQDVLVGHGLALPDRPARHPSRVETQRPLGEQQHHGGAQQKATDRRFNHLGPSIAPLKSPQSVCNARFTSSETGFTTRAWCSGASFALRSVYGAQSQAAASRHRRDRGSARSPQR